MEFWCVYLTNTKYLTYLILIFHLKIPTHQNRNNLHLYTLLYNCHKLQQKWFYFRTHYWNDLNTWILCPCTHERPFKIYIPYNHTYCSINRTATTIPTNTSISVVWLWLIELYKLHPITAQFVHRVIITLIFLDSIGSLVFTWWVFVIVSK